MPPLRRASIAGFEPKVEWTPNPGGQRRTMAEAVEIARKYGVEIPEYLHFIDDAEAGLLADTPFTARGPGVSKPPGGYVTWADHVDPATGKIPVHVRADVLTSDEAIVGVLAHEAYEFSELESMLEYAKKNRIVMEDYVANHAPGVKGNLHWGAWEVADEAVLRMRGAKR